MEIGGHDLFFPTTLSKQEASVLVEKLASQCWPEMVVEHDNMVGQELDLFLHEDSKARKYWDEFGAPENGAVANMIYAIFGEGQMTLVYDPGMDSERVAKFIHAEIVGKSN